MFFFSFRIYLFVIIIIQSKLFSTKVILYLYFLSFLQIDLKIVAFFNWWLLSFVVLAVCITRHSMLIYDSLFVDVGRSLCVEFTLFFLYSKWNVNVWISIAANNMSLPEFFPSQYFFTMDYRFRVHIGMHTQFTSCARDKLRMENVYLFFIKWKINWREWTTAICMIHVISICLCTQFGPFKRCIAVSNYNALLYLCWKIVRKKWKQTTNRNVLCAMQNTTYLLLALKWRLWSKCNFAIFVFALWKISIGTRAIVQCFTFEWNELWMYTLHAEHWIPFKLGESHNITINTIE